MVYRKKKLWRRKPKRTLRRNTRRKLTMGKLQVSRGLRQSVHFFKRRSISYMNNAGSAGFTHTLDGLGLVKTISVAFNQLEGNTDFPNLYKMYKIHAVRIKLIPTPQLTTGSSTVTTTFPVVCSLRYTYNRTGDDISSSNTISDWLQQSAVKQRTIPSIKPISLYCRPRVATSLYNNPIAGYGVRKPPYISLTNVLGSTNNTGLPHFCFDLRIDRVDGGGIPNPLTPDLIPFAQIETTAYFSCKGVH